MTGGVEDGVEVLVLGDEFEEREGSGGVGGGRRHGFLELKNN